MKQLSYITLHLFLTSLPILAFTAHDELKRVSSDGSVSDTTAAIEYVRSRQQDGWVITVGLPDGRYLWSSSVTINIPNAVTIQGASPTNRPAVLLTSNARISIITSNGKTTTLKDFLIAGNGTADTLIDIRGDDLNPNVFRISNVRFQARPQRAVWIRTGYGLIDNCFFEGDNAGIGSIQIEQLPYRLDGSAQPWKGDMQFGTTSTVTIEDCTFTKQGVGYISQAIDSNKGGRYIFRHNYCTNFNVATHGDDSGGVNSSVLHGEIHHNYFHYTLAPDFVMILRGGSHVVFSNTVTFSDGQTPNWMVKQWYLRGNATGGGGQARSPLYNSYPNDYPGPQQVGRGVTGGVQGQPFPTYFWSNRWSSVGWGLISSGYDASDARFIVDGRDFFSNTPKPNYTPLTYPHPLQTGTIPLPDSMKPLKPRNLMIQASP